MPGSGTRAVAFGVLALVVLVSVVALAATYGPLRHTSLPGHPYPPAGYLQNPFSSNPDDLLSVADLARVRSEFERDSQIDLQAVESGDTATLAQARTGSALASLRTLIETNNARGIAEREQVKDDALVVGQLPDPRGPASAKWCVEERGTGTIAYVMKSTGVVVRAEAIPFDYRIWLVQVSGRFLITDVGAV